LILDVTDIVCEEGDCWVKVVARNPKALDLNSQVSMRQQSSRQQKGFRFVSLVCVLPYQNI
jgi:hypothetical protein